MATQKTILVVDDSKAVRMLLANMLAPAGFQILEAADGALGLQQAATAHVDLIIVDVNMPVMTGLEMVAHVRRLPAHSKTPIFVLTTESTQEVAQQGKAAGATAWIVKPPNAQALLAGINKVLG